MQLEQRFSIEQLETINEQAMIYTCSCPAQVSAQITAIRKLYDYQLACLDRPQDSELQAIVHRRIAEASRESHRILEQCLDEVLTLEGWNRETMQMPAGLRILLEKAIDAG